MTKRFYSYEETHRTVKGVKQKLCRRCKKWKKGSLFYRSGRLEEAAKELNALLYRLDDMNILQRASDQ